MLLVGGGHLEGETILEHKQLAERLGIGPFVVFAGSREQSEMGSLMSLAEVLVSPRSEGDNTPLKLYSYMAAKRPIVATRISAHLQVLDEQSAHFADPQPEDLARALEESLDSSEQGQERNHKLVKNARHLIDSKYNESEFDRRLVEMYSDVIGPAQVPELK